MTTLPPFCDFSPLTGSQILLFYGPQGSGKSTYAERLARFWLGSSKAEHPDLHILTPPYAISTMRDMLDEVALPPFEAPYKVFVLHAVEEMSDIAVNALLKTLEEPPSDTRMMLLTTHRSALLPTLLSRCVQVPFHPVSETGLQSTPPSIDVASLLACTSYHAIYRHMTQHPIPDELSPEEIRQLFHAMIAWMQTHDLRRLGRLFALIQDGERALEHHVKLKTVLERLLLMLLEPTVP